MTDGQDRRRRFTQEQQALAVELYLSGLGSVEVAGQIGASHHTVLVWVRRAGHRPRRPGVAARTED